MALENVGAVMSGDSPPEALGVRALDNHTLEVRLTASLPYFAAMTTHASTFPSPEWTVRTFGDEWTKPGNIVGNGAYVLTEHIPNETATRERNTMYWNNDATIIAVSYTHLRAHETGAYLVCRLLLEKKN